MTTLHIPPFSCANLWKCAVEQGRAKTKTITLPWQRLNAFATTQFTGFAWIAKAYPDYF
jgi:hypothetical protein